MKPEYTHPAAARWAAMTAGARRNGRRPPSGPRSSVRSEKHVLTKRRAARSRTQVAAYESRIRLGNWSRTAASRIPRVCAFATRRKRRRSPWRGAGRKAARNPLSDRPRSPLAPIRRRAANGCSFLTETPWRPLTNEHGVSPAAYQSVLCPAAFANASRRVGRWGTLAAPQSRPAPSSAASLRTTRTFHWITRQFSRRIYYVYETVY